MTAGQGRTRPADVAKELTIHEYIEETVEHHIEEEETMFKVARQVVSPLDDLPFHRRGRMRTAAANGS